MKLKIHVDPEEAVRHFFPIFISASHDGRKRADEIYMRLRTDLEELYQEKFRHYERLEREHLSIQTPDEKLNIAFQWAKVAVDKAFVCNPQLGCGLIAGYGLSGRSERPGFAWFFGGDAFFNSWALTSIGSFDVTRQGLAFIKKNQRQDGKIMHELSQGAAFIPWFEEYPYGFYHAETTPYYIVSLHNYLNWSGDLEFIKESWASIKKAYEYVLSADSDGDGLMGQELFYRTEARDLLRPTQRQRQCRYGTQAYENGVHQGVGPQRGLEGMAHEVSIGDDGAYFGGSRLCPGEAQARTGDCEPRVLCWYGSSAFLP